MKNTEYLMTIKHGGFHSLVKRAIELGMGVELISPENNITCFSYKREKVYIKGKNAPAYRRMGDMTRKKIVTKLVLENLGIRTPRGIEAATIKDAQKKIKDSSLEYPLLLKPSAGTRGLGVTWGIKNSPDLKKAIALFEKASKENPFLVTKARTFLVEEMFQGDEYRVLVLDGKVVSCVHKIPATIIGDGKSSIKKLIDAFNATRNEGFFIHVDKTVKNTLKKNVLDMGSVLPKNTTLRLRNNLNMSDGGRSIDVTKTLHPKLKSICVRAVQGIGLTYGGVDLMAKDITNPKTRYVILEINSNPYYNMNEKPLVEGTGTDISWLFLKKMFPRLKKSPKAIEK